MQAPPETIEGILLIDKPKGFTSFTLVRILRKRFGVQKIGHAGTLDPLATGVMVLLIGKRYTRISNTFLECDKEYVAEIFLGSTTDTYDAEGAVIDQSSFVPSKEEVDLAIASFQGKIEQIPPMYSAKKQDGKKLYDLARKGIEVTRKAVIVDLSTYLIRYEYPYIEIRVVCSKGTYIRSIAHDLGKLLGCGAHLSNLKRTRSGTFTLSDCVTEAEFSSPLFPLQSRLLT